MERERQIETFDESVNPGAFQTFVSEHPELTDKEATSAYSERLRAYREAVINPSVARVRHLVQVVLAAVPPTE